jgi:hypothetical protein
MKYRIDYHWHEKLQEMSLGEKRALLRAIIRLRVHCRDCPVRRPQPHAEPCYSCTVLPGILGMPKSTVN